MEGHFHSCISLLYQGELKQNSFPGKQFVFFVQSYFIGLIDLLFSKQQYSYNAHGNRIAI